MDAFNELALAIKHRSERSSREQSLPRRIYIRDKHDLINMRLVQQTDGYASSHRKIYGNQNSRETSARKPHKSSSRVNPLLEEEHASSQKEVFASKESMDEIRDMVEVKRVSSKILQNYQQVRTS